MNEPRWTIDAAGYAVAPAVILNEEGIEEAVTLIKAGNGSHD